MLARLREWISEINFPLLSMPSVGFAEVIDILIVAYIVYFVLKWIRQTRAWSLMKGVFAILAIAAASWLFELTTVLWILQNAFAMGLIVVVVLFQPELRNALEQIGRGRLFSALTKTDGDARISINTINEVVKAASSMAEVSTGALIVLEQDVATGEHESTGIPVDAMVSSQLLFNIFEKNTPLHDGAVIIRNNRIVAASCILPLTTDEIGRELGTRHRAAVGVSEVSDALAIVVSEEKGSISIAAGGQLMRNLSENELRDILMTGYDPVKQGFTLFRNMKTGKKGKKSRRARNRG
jgi:diadenylate cyclase